MIYKVRVRGWRHTHGEEGAETEMSGRESSVASLVESERWQIR